MKSLQKCLKNRGGFTLTELLVVILIIIVLASLTTIVFTSARKKAQLATATNRVADLQLANQSYAAEHGGRFVSTYATDEEGGHPDARKWMHNPDFLEMLIGPDDSDNRAFGQPIYNYPEEILDPVALKAGLDKLLGNFGYIEENMPGGDWKTPGSNKFHTPSSIADPSRVAAFVTANDWLVRYSGRYIWFNDPVDKITGDGRVAYRHDDKAIVVYYDGHTEALDIEDMKDLDRAGRRNNVFWGGETSGRGRQN